MAPQFTINMKMKPTLVALFLFALAAVSASAQSSQPAVLSAPGGRYVFGQISSMRADQYMLDTQTGRLWQLVVDTNGASLLQEVPYKTLGGSFVLAPATTQAEVQELQNEVQAVKSEHQTNQPPNTSLEPTPTAHSVSTKP